MLIFSYIYLLNTTSFLSRYFSYNLSSFKFCTCCLGSLIVKIQTCYLQKCLSSCCMYIVFRCIYPNSSVYLMGRKVKWFLSTVGLKLLLEIFAVLKKYRLGMYQNYTSSMCESQASLECVFKGIQPKKQIKKCPPPLYTYLLRQNGSRAADSDFFFLHYVCSTYEKMFKVFSINGVTALS